MPATLALGTMNFGTRTREDEARRIIDAALAAGVTAFDTANLYGDGESERILGRALGARRGTVRLTTKVGLWRREGLSRQRIVASLDESLGRLQTDFVEVYLWHAPDSRTSLDESLDGVEAVLASGKARAWGVSNMAAWQLVEVMLRCDARGLPRPVQSQVLYNLAVRQLDLEYFAFARRFPLTTTIYNPLAGGLLARDPTASVPPSARLSSNALYKRRYGSDAMVTRAKAFRQVAADLGVDLLTLAYAFVLQRPGVDVVLTGPATVDQLEAALAAARVQLSDEGLKRIDEVSRQLDGTDASYAR
ncbi:MAG: aldo/keto reductase [Myxococcaceae bacterium]|nr:aldo/keto reductase [Myxococcaceae bacterium]